MWSFSISPPFRVAEVRLLRRGYVKIHHPVFGIVFAGRLVPLLIIEAGNHGNDDITQILVVAAERGGSLGLQIGERSMALVLLPLQKRIAKTLWAASTQY